MTATLVVSAKGTEAGVPSSRPEEATELLSGVWVAQIRNLSVVSGTIRHLGPKGRFFQSMMHPEGTSVVFWGLEEGAVGSDIWICASDGSDLRRLTTDGQGNEGPFWFPDGKRIAYTSKRTEAVGTTRPGADSSVDGKLQGYHIWVMDANGDNKRQLTRGSWNDARPCVSPDGKTIVFASNRSGGQNLWRMDSDRGEPVQVTKHNERDFRPVFSPDGNYLAYFTNQTRTGKNGLAIVKWPDGKSTLSVAIKGEEWTIEFRTSNVSEECRFALGIQALNAMQVLLYFCEIQ
jgi:WD40 repeat protein